MADACSATIVASGGAGKLEHFYDALAAIATIINKKTPSFLPDFMVKFGILVKLCVDKVVVKLSTQRFFNQKRRL
jgi:hypothetical protein